MVKELLEKKQEFLQYLTTLNGQVDGDFIVRQGKRFGLSKNQAIAALRDKYTGRISYPCQQDALGVSVRLEDLIIYVYPPKLDCAVSVDLLSGSLPETFAINCLLEYVRPGDTVVDVGANIGYHSLRYAQAVGWQGRVLAFEPDPWNFIILQRNIITNGMHPIHAYCTALGEHNEIITLYKNPVNRGDIRSWDMYGNWEKLAVKCCRLDSFFQQVPPTFQAMKIDVQGMEKAVVQGAANLIMQQKHLALYLENWPEGADIDRQQFYHLLRELDFHYFYQVDDEREELTLVEYYPEANLLCVKGW